MPLQYQYDHVKLGHKVNERVKPMQNQELYEKAIRTRDMYRAGLITREQAKKDIKPYAEFFDEVAAEKAKKYGMKPQKFSFIGFMR